MSQKEAGQDAWNSISGAGNGICEDSKMGETPGPVEDLRVDGVVDTVRERRNEVSGGQEAGPIVEKVDGSHMRV